MKVKNLPAYRHMRDSRARLCFYKTYFGTALWALKFVEVENLIKQSGAPLAADKFWRVYYDPEFVLKCNLKVMMAGLLHELGHLVRGHHERAVAHGIQAINHMAWNVAGDMELNDDLEKDPEVDMKGMPWDYVTPGKFGQPDEKLAEWYYNHMPKKNIPCNQCGSAATGVPQPWEQAGDAAGADKVGKAEGRLIAKQTAESIKAHSRSRGTVSGGWERWADNFGAPVVNWRKTLSALVRNRLAQVYGNFDYSYAKSNRRQAMYGKIIMPAMIQPVPKVAIVIDVSGSMTKKDLGMCMAEITGILQAVGIGEVFTYVVDSEVQGQSGKKITSVKDIVLTGGGGTDMRVGIAAAIKEAKGDLDVVIVLTDGYTPWPAAEDHTAKIIAVLTQNSLDQLPPHIKGVCINES